MKIKKIRSICFLFFSFFFFTVIGFPLAGADCGDVNSDAIIDSVDALLIARYYVDLDVQNFDPDLADVDGNDDIEIIDALLVARFYVGLITEFPGICDAWEDTPIPTDPPAATPISFSPGNMDILLNHFPLSASEETKLMNTGILVLDHFREESFTLAYNDIADMHEIPLFLTTDTLLHVFHLTYADMLENAEQVYLYDKAIDLFEGLEYEVLLVYINLGGSSNLKEACKRALVFAGVAHALIQGRGQGEDTVSIHTDVDLEINDLLDKIYQATLVEQPPGEDYTLYKPRSHYTDDDVLTPYFLAMTWCERYKMNAGRDSSAGDMLIEIAEAAILSCIILQNTNLRNSFNYIDQFLTKLKNKQSGITLSGIYQAMIACLDDFSTQGYSLLETEGNRNTLRDELALGYYGKNLFVQLLGERDSLDLKILDQTAHPEVDARIFPMGLDVAAVVFNSIAAYEELGGEMSDFPALGPIVDLLRGQYNILEDDVWKESVSNYWLSSLRLLSEDLTGNVPPFTQTDAWKREKLNTQLAAWTELHSDSIYVPITPVQTPSPTSSPTSPPGTGNLWFVPQSVSVDLNSEFDLAIHLNSGSQNLAAYAFHILYNQNMISVYDVEAGWDGFIAAANFSEPGSLSVDGFDPSGKGPGSDMEIIIVYLRADAPGATIVELVVDTLVDSHADIIGVPTGGSAYVNINTTTGLNGDVNGDSRITIIDALLTAQYYVGMNPEGFNVKAADTNCDGAINIIDALLIAQYFVGLIDSLECNLPTPDSTPPSTPNPTNVPTLTPTPDPPICFVEPYPDFYLRLRQMCEQVLSAIDEGEMTLLMHTLKFQDMYNWSAQLAQFAQMQLDGIPFTPENYNIIHKFGTTLGKYFSTGSFVPELDAKAQVISDIYAYESRILHEAVGRLHPIIVVCPVSGNDISLAAVGYVLSYYEFDEPDSIRFTDSEWEQKLKSGPPPKPTWTSAFLE